MGQAFTAGSIAAIVVILITAVILAVFVYTYAPKKNSGLQLSPSGLQPRLNNGVSARILCIATGRYLRRRPDSSCAEDKLNLLQGETLVTADATRAEATIWKFELCSSCPSVLFADQGFPYDPSGRWAIFDPVATNESHFLTLGAWQGAFTQAAPDGNTVTKTVLKETDAAVAQGVNNLESHFWFELINIAKETEFGSEGAYSLITEPTVGIFLRLTALFANGIYFNPTYRDPVPQGYTDYDPSQWDELTCFQLWPIANVGSVSDVFPNSLTTFYIEIV